MLLVEELVVLADACCRRVVLTAKPAPALELVPVPVEKPVASAGGGPFRRERRSNPGKSSASDGRATRAPGRRVAGAAAGAAAAGGSSDNVNEGR